MFKFNRVLHSVTVGTKIPASTATAAKVASFSSTPSASLNSREEIENILSQPTWCVSELFEKTPKDTTTERPTYETLSKLLKQAGLNSVGEHTPRAVKLLKELDTQLTFVGHISEVDTEGIDPLVRISGEPIKARLEDLSAISTETAPETVEPNNWNPVSLAAENSNNFYVLHEGLVREG